MNNEEQQLETQRQRARARLGNDNPACVICGEGEPLCLELHHVAGRAYDEAVAILCRNCHRKQSQPWLNERAPAKPPVMERAGRLLLGLVSFLLALIESVRRLGEQLLDGAKVCPWPYGWIGAPEVAR